MKILKLIFICIVFLAITTAIFCFILYFKGNKEKTALTDNERKGTTGQYIKLSQGVTHYQLQGPDTGKVVILVHGFSVPYYIWDGTYEYLVAQGFRVLRYDLFGRGYSDRPDANYNNAFYEQQLFDLIHQLHLKTPLNIAGVSFGGRLAADFTSQYPSLVNKVILIDPAYYRPAPAQAHPQFYTRFDETTHADDRANLQLTDFKYPTRHPGWVDRYRVQMQYKGFRNALVSTMYNYDYNGKKAFVSLNKTRKAVLLIWGKEDRTVPFTCSDSVRSVLTCDFFAVDDAAHLPQIEQPAKVNDRIGAFFRK